MDDDWGYPYDSGNLHIKMDDLYFQHWFASARSLSSVVSSLEVTPHVTMVEMIIYQVNVAEQKSDQMLQS